MPARVADRQPPPVPARPGGAAAATVASLGSVVCALCALCALCAGCSNTQAPAASGPHTGTATASPRHGVQVVTVDASDDYRFHPATIVVGPGRVRIRLHNTERNGAPHDLKVTGVPGAYVPAAGAGQTVTATFTAPKPGRYRFVCTFHVQQGMTGTLVVKRHLS